MSRESFTEGCMELESSLERWGYLEEKGEYIADWEAVLSLHCPHGMSSMIWQRGTEVSKTGRVPALLELTIWGEVDSSPEDRVGSETSSI